jgi:hypothetical protein
MYDELWYCGGAGITLGGRKVEDVIDDDLCDIEDCQAQFFISLKDCSLLGPFLYNKDDDMRKAAALSRDANYICAFAK